MKRIIPILMSVATTLAATAIAQAGPGAILSLAEQVNGSVTATSVRPGGCPTLICTTNDVTREFCFTNWEWELVCTTNAGQIQCTNIQVPIVRCFTNTYPEITCTNEFLAPTSVTVSEQLTGALTGIIACDEILFPSNATFEALLYLSVRTNDWIGTEVGTFKIVSGTNILAFGSMNGLSGVRTPLPSGLCAECNHFLGTLRGALLSASALPGAQIQAAYAGDINGAQCPSADLPQGAVTMVIDGVAVTPCFNRIGFPEPEQEPVASPGGKVTPTAAPVTTQ